MVLRTGIAGRVKMSDVDDKDNAYEVVVNQEEQYSIWPVGREIPGGWKKVGRSGTRDECLESVKELWTDMRPLSLRRQMEAAARRPRSGAPTSAASKTDDASLVRRLCEGDHAIEVETRGAPSAQRLKERIDRGFVHIKFTETEGGTELGVRLDPATVDVGKADFASGVGEVRLEGSLVLDFVEVRCVAAIDLATFRGAGRLQRLEER